MLKYILIGLFICGHLMPVAAENKPKVVASASMIADMVVQIAGDLVDLETIVPIGGDPHLHEPIPRDARIVTEADLIFINGLTFEGWIVELIQNSGTAAIVDTVSNGVAVIRSTKYQDSVDPHAWMDVSNARIYAQNITNALIRLLPNQSEILQQRRRAYDQLLKETDAFIEQEVSKIPEARRILITSHDAFAYYGKRYGIRLEAIQGISTEAEAQTSDVMRVSQVIRDHDIPAIFIESTINPKLLKQLADDNNTAIGGELYADSLGDEDSPASTYVDMMRHNTTSIVKGLTGQSDFASEKIQDPDRKQSFLLYIVIALLLIGGFAFVAKRMTA